MYSNIITKLSGKIKNKNVKMLSFDFKTIYDLRKFVINPDYFIWKQIIIRIYFITRLKIWIKVEVEIKSL